MRYFSRLNRRGGKLAVLLLKTALALGIIAFLVTRADIRPENFAGLSIGLLATAAGLILAQNALTAVRWYFLMRCVAVRPGFYTALSLTLQGIFFTLFIPGGAVSGDVVKAALVARGTSEGEKFHAVFSILIDRVTGLCGLLLLTFCSALPALLWGRTQFGPAVQWALWAVTLAAPAGVVTILAAFRYDLLLRIGWIRAIHHRIDGWTHGLLSRLDGAMALYRGSWRTLLLWVLISGFLGFPLIALAILLIYLAVMQGLLAAPIFSFFLAGSVGETVSMLPLTPGGIGTRDVVLLEVFKAYGCTVEQSTLIPVVYTTLFVVVSLAGAGFMLTDAMRSRKRTP